MKVRSLQSEGVCENVDITIHHCLGAEETRVLIVDVSRYGCLRSGHIAVGDRVDRPLRNHAIIDQSLVDEI